MNHEELADRQRLEREKYDRDVAKRWAETRRPTDRERAVIDAIFPGYNDKPDTLMSIEINKSAMKQAKKIVEALRGVSETPTVEELADKMVNGLYERMGWTLPPEQDRSDRIGEHYTILAEIALEVLK